MCEHTEIASNRDPARRSTNHWTSPVTGTKRRRKNGRDISVRPSAPSLARGREFEGERRCGRATIFGYAITKVTTRRLERGFLRPEYSPWTRRCVQRPNLSRPATSPWCSPEAACTKSARNPAGRHFAQAVAGRPDWVRVLPQCGLRATAAPEIRQCPSQHSVEPRSRPKLALARKQTIYGAARAWGERLRPTGSLRSRARGCRLSIRHRAHP